MTAPPANPGGREAFFRSHDPTTMRAGSFAQVALVDELLMELLEEQRQEGVGYVEIRLSPERWHRDGAALDEAIRRADAAVGLSRAPRSRLVILINRATDAGTLEAILDTLENRRPSSVVGVDLAGDEVAHPDLRRFIPAFAAFKASGLGVTVHAGEFGGPQQVWDALDQLGADRIAHGLSAVHDADLMRRLAREQVMIELSVSTNLMLGAVVGLESHPLRSFVDHGIPVCFNTDVPLYTGTSLTEELTLAAAALHADVQEIMALQLMARDHGFDRSSTVEAGQP